MSIRVSKYKLDGDLIYKKVRTLIDNCPFLKSCFHLYKIPPSHHNLNDIASTSSFSKVNREVLKNEF